MAAMSGGTAGVLGLTGLYGFVFYVLAVIGLWVSLSFEIFMIIIIFHYIDAFVS